MILKRNVRHYIFYTYILNILTTILNQGAAQQAAPRASTSSGASGSGGQQGGGGWQKQGGQGGQAGQSWGSQQKQSQGQQSRPPLQQQRAPGGNQQGQGGYQQRQQGQGGQGGYLQRPQGQQGQGGPGGYQQRPQGQQGGQGQQQQLLPQPAGSIKRGTIGKPGQVAVNYLDIDMSKMPPKAYHYDVKIMPERPKKFYRQAFEQYRIDQLKGAIAAFDGRASCYAVDKLPLTTQNSEVTVSFKETKKHTVFQYL